jgi:hypothetical protein
MVGYARTRGAFAPGNPNGAATALAAGLGRALAAQPDLDLSRYLRDNLGQLRQATYVVLSDGRSGSTSEQPLRAAILDRSRRLSAATLPNRPVTTRQQGLSSWRRCR